MSKRFTDTDKYKKTFMRSLPGAYKLFWDYLYHDCNHAGVWHVDFEIAAIYLGKDMVINAETALRLFNETEKRVEVVANGRKWFIKPFIEFQYKVSVEDLNPANKVHASIISTLAKEGVCKPLAYPLLGLKDKDKDKKLGVEVRGGSEGVTKEKHLEWFGKLWKAYPAERRHGRPAAFKRFVKTVKSLEDAKRCARALESYLKKCEDRQFLLRASRWFEEWEDHADDTGRSGASFNLPSPERQAASLDAREGVKAES